jgi:hypothetical protein
MVLVGMGKNQTIYLLTALSDKVGVGHLNTSPAGTPPPVMLKSDATIDDKPAAIMAVEVEVHAYFTATPQWQKPGSLRPRTTAYHA